MCLSRSGMTKADSARALGKYRLSLWDQKLSSAEDVLCCFGKWRVGYQCCLLELASLDWITHPEEVSALPCLAAQDADPSAGQTACKSPATTTTLPSTPRVPAGQSCCFLGAHGVGFDPLSFSNTQAEHSVLCHVFIYRHARQPSPSGTGKHSPHTPNTCSYFGPSLPPKPGNPDRDMKEQLGLAVMK